VEENLWIFFFEETYGVNLFSFYKEIWCTPFYGEACGANFVSLGN